MPDLLYPYLIGFVTTIVVSVIAIISFVTFHLRGLEYERLRKRLPWATRHDDLEMRVDDLQDKRNQLSTELAEAHRIIDEADRQQTWLETHRDEIERMRIEKGQLEQHQLDYEQVTGDLAIARESLEEANRSLAEVTWQTEQRTNQISDLDNQIKELESRQKSVTEQLTSYQTERDEIESRLHQVRKEEIEITQAIESLRSNRSELEARLQQLSSEVKDLEERAQSLNASAAATSATVASLDQQIEDKSTHLNELRQEAVRRGSTAMATFEDSLTDLWTPAIPPDEFDDEQDPLEEESAIQNVETYLQDLGLIFSTRTVRAFHTALKTSEQTPLTVLAGISGTGKSLLPRRYSEAMGMHFLPVPVQPRWDGPQDLLGFFNYLESRYSSTELIRSLLQFDAYEDWSPDEYASNDLSNRLLIVLLDEMNLARIEYYFSEFLSRLEMRRDIDRENKTDRAKSSILLDIGQFTDQTKPYIFVDTNVMFVGTMNEDESTMSLSDKVVDRASIMRFGKPPSLENLVAESYPQRTSQYINRSQWKAWINAGNQRELPPFVAQIVGNLNNSLAEIGRPFGYRTADAIQEYVRQYPDQSESGIKDALADQIEQRIMPKLRGIDTGDDRAAQTVQSLLDIVTSHLNDPALVQAIEDARQAHHGSLFQWSGVARTASD